METGIIVAKVHNIKYQSVYISTKMNQPYLILCVKRYRQPECLFNSLFGRTTNIRTTSPLLGESTVDQTHIRDGS